MGGTFMNLGRMKCLENVRLKTSKNSIILSKKYERWSYDTLSSDSNKSRHVLKLTKKKKERKK